MLVTAATRVLPAESLPDLKTSAWAWPAKALRVGWRGGKRVTTWWPGVRGLGSRSLTGAEPSAAGGSAARVKWQTTKQRSSAVAYFMDGPLLGARVSSSGGDGS